MTIIFEKVTNCAKGGKFVKVKQLVDGVPEDIYIINRDSHITTYGVGKYNNFPVYMDKRSSSKESIKSLESYIKVEQQILDLARDKFNVNKARSRIVNMETHNDMCKIMLKGKPGFNSVIRDLNGSIIDLSVVKQKCHVFTVIKLDSLFINNSVGIVPQLKIQEAIIVKCASGPSLMTLDIEFIRRKYESSRIKDISFTTIDEEIEE